MNELRALKYGNITKVIYIFSSIALNLTPGF